MSGKRSSFRVLIIGAGLGGLGAAVCLAHKGHKVTVLEANAQLSEVGAGIQVPPNSARVLDSYGLKKRLLQVVTWPNNLVYRRYATGEVLNSTPLQPMMMETYGNPYWLIHRADYRNLLYDAAKEAGANIIFGAAVECVEEREPSVVLQDGRKIEADIVVGADGIHSRTRSAVVQGKAGSVNDLEHYAYRFTIPARVMKSDSDLRGLMTGNNTDCWIGPGGHAMGYPIRLGSLYNLVLPHSGRAVGGKSNEPGDLAEMKAYYAKFDPRISKALSKVSECLRWKLEDLPPLPRWVSESGRVVLIGDAAHAMLPYLAQGAAMAIEDGAALGECLDRARSVRDLRRVMHAFEAIRKPRCERIQASARGLGYLWHLPDGAQQEERDKAMKAVAVEGDSHDLNPNKFADEEFQAWMFGYDVFTATNKMLDAVLDPQSKL